MGDLTKSATGGEIRGSFQRLRSDMGRLNEDLKAAILSRDVRLLHAFYSFAESNEQRLAHAEANTNAIMVRLATLEIRLLEVEKPLNMPPAA